MSSKNRDLHLHKLRIVLCTHAYPPKPGGIAAFARDIFTAFKNAGSSIEIFETINKNNGESGRITNYLQKLKTTWNLFLYVKKNQPDAIICSRMIPSGLMAAAVAFFFKTKIIVQVHGTELKGRHEKGWRHWIIRNLYNGADQIWANTKFTANLLETYGCETDRIKIIYPFITRDAQNLAHTLKKKNSNKRLTVFTAATLYPRKGIDLVLKSLAQLQELDWEYRIAGKPPGPAYAGFYEKMAEDLGISERVTFLGQLNRKQLWSEMDSASIFVMPSRGYKEDIESFGIVFIEAGLFGVPSIGSNVGGIKEAIGNAGMLIKDENIDELTRCIRQLIENESLRSQLSQKAHNRVQKKFTEKTRRIDICNALTDLNL